jgi:hypothetical protein
MNILFLHQNFPGQFKHLAPALAAQGHALKKDTHLLTVATPWRKPCGCSI